MTSKASDIQTRWYEILLKERFALCLKVSRADGGLQIEMPGQTSGKIVIPKENRFFQATSSDIPCTNWPVQRNLQAPIFSTIPMPGMADAPTKLVFTRNNDVHIAYDILGLCFWTLNRLEEINCKNLDELGRFPVSASHAYQHGYLERPIVDEWLAILAQAIQLCWPDKRVKKTCYELQVTHDVDRPFKYLFLSPSAVLKQIAGDLLKRKSVSLGLKRFKLWFLVKLGLHHLDPYNTFNFIFDTSSTIGIKSIFFFICGRTEPKFDADYDIKNPIIMGLITEISNRGHALGLHPSFNTYKSENLLKIEKSNLISVLQKLKLSNVPIRSRMHYLRWDHPSTLENIRSCGIDEDFSLGYTNHAGFRCGTSHSFTPFNPISNEILSLKIQPLILMDAFVLSATDFSDDINDRIRKAADIANCIKKVGGKFSILWHNSELETEEQKILYSNLLQLCK